MKVTGMLPTIVGATAVLLMAVPLHAQPAQDPQSTQQFEAAPDPGQQSAPRPVTPPASIRPAYWTANAGFEADTHDSGYGFAGPFYVKPFRPNTSFVAGANLNYLYYDYASGLGHTNVRSPGVNVTGGVRFGHRNYVQLVAGPGFKRRYVERVDANGNVIGSDRNIDAGLNLGADAYVDPTSHSNVYGMFRYGAEDQYSWGRLAYKEQITNRDWHGKFAHSVGAEVIGQGNDDIRSTQVGALYEIAHGPSSVSVMLRAGYKRSAYDIGPDKTGPYFAIGLWHKLH
jgi:hypothetical protein